MVIAGPGTGKTEILSLRIGYILKETDTPPGSILCLTYTDAAASEMRHRLIKYIGPEAYSIQVNTFHSFCNLVIQEAEKPGQLHPSSQRRFHFDYAGWHSLNLFIYLTDVERDSGSHQVVVGTHKYKHVRDAIRPSLDDEEVERRFGAQIRTIAGPAGTMFFEDTEAFHRRVAVRERRAMLNILFASHRSPFSRGRLVKSHRELVASRARQSV